MARVAADHVARGKTRIKVKHLTEFDFGGRGRIAGQVGWGGRDWLEQLLSFHQQIFLSNCRHCAHAAQNNQRKSRVPNHGESSLQVLKFVLVILSKAHQAVGA
jgi:hypothetical protein